jgi:hypothetical protein
VKIIYSFNKRGFEADYWTREISAASTAQLQILPFNHGDYLDASFYIRAQLLDNVYYAKHPKLLAMYAAIQELMKSSCADVLLVDNCFPYHPEFLRKLSIYKVLRITDGPLSSYDRDFAYLHAYDHVLYPRKAYSEDMDLAEKLTYCGAKRLDYWPLGSFDALCDPGKTEADIFAHERDIDVVFVGALHLDKMPMLARIKKKLGRRMRFHGLASFKKNAYFNLKFGFPGWIRPLKFSDYVPLYQRAKIGINVHLRGPHTLAGYRMFDLPANGVMQISDGGPYLNDLFEVGTEIESYQAADELADKVDYYLAHPQERQAIALKGFKRVRRDYKIGHLLRRLPELLGQKK